MTARGKNALAVSGAIVAAWWVYSAVTQLLHPHPMPDSVAAIAVNVTIRTSIVLAIVYALLRWNGETLGSLGFRIDSAWRFALRTLWMSIALFIVSNVVLNTMFGKLFGASDGAPPIASLFRDRADVPIWIYCAVVGGGFGEELARSFVLTRYEKLFGRGGLVAALVVDSLVFGGGHLYQGRASAASTACTGLILALIFLRRKRVIDAMAVHATFDLLGIAAGYALYTH